MRVNIKSNISLLGYRTVPYRRCGGGGGGGWGVGVASCSLVAGALLEHALLSRETVTLRDIFIIKVCIQIRFRVVTYITVVGNTDCRTLM